MCLGGPLYPCVAYSIFHHTRTQNTTFAFLIRKRKQYFLPWYGEKIESRRFSYARRLPVERQSPRVHNCLLYARVAYTLLFLTSYGITLRNECAKQVIPARFEKQCVCYACIKKAIFARARILLFFLFFHHTVAESTAFTSDSKTRMWYFWLGYGEKYYTQHRDKVGHTKAHVCQPRLRLVR